MTTPALTSRQQEMLDFIADYRDKQGMPPSRREIQAHFGFKSMAAVDGHLRLMEKKGAIRRAANKARGLVIDKPQGARPGQSSDANNPSEGTRFASIPIYGSIPAGVPADQMQENDGCVRVDLDSIGLPPSTSRTFALRVRGESMINAGILDKDIVILDFRPPSDGAIVAALVDGDTTLKRYTVKGGKPFLKAENPKFKNIIPAQELVIQGVMIALLRRA
ncbi:MAG: transcriptional repressor LexA [Candidatus Methylacidiphilales bacterium]